MKRVIIVAHSNKNRKHKKKLNLTYGNYNITMEYSEIGIALAQYCTIIETLTGDTRSIQQIFERFTHEGKPYLTTVLPMLGKAVDRSLEIQRIPAASLKYVPRDNEGFPTLFNGLFRDLYVTDGVNLYLNIIKDESLKVLRQLLFYFYKVREEFTEQDIAKYSQKYADFERSLVEPPVDHGKFLDRLAIRRVKGIIRELLDAVAIPEYNSRYMRPKTTHGNGAVADEAQWAFRIQRRYQLNVTKDNVNYIGRVISSPKVYTITSYTPYAALVLVPKDSRGPRIICKENSTNMLLQQYYMRLLYDTLPQISGINFQDQTVNAKLAYYASLDNSYATIDLKDASDRVQVWHIEKLFPKEWRDVLLSTRSKYLVLGDGRRILLRKFAAMGSALCFPVEALIFYAIAKSCTDEVKVYGDDIIVPTSKALEVMTRLERFGFKVNRDKSLYRGFFKESCGAFFYKGHDVSIIYRRKWQSSIEHINELIQKFGSPLGEALYRCSGLCGLVYPAASDAVWMPNASGATWALQPSQAGEKGLLIPPRAADLAFFRWRFSKEKHIYERYYYKNISSPNVRFFVKDDILYDEWLRRYSGTDLEYPVNETADGRAIVKAWTVQRSLLPNSALVEERKRFNAYAMQPLPESRSITITQQREAVLKLRWIG